MPDSRGKRLPLRKLYPVQAATTLLQEVRPPRERAVNALSNMYRCGDGRWFLLAIVREERLWPRLCRALGHPELAEDPRFADNAGRRAHAARLVAELDRILERRPWDEWRPRLDGEGITFAEVNTLAEVVADPQLLAAGALVPLDDADAGARQVVSSPFAFEGLAKVPAGPAPALGADTEAVLTEVGYGADDLVRLRAAGAFG